MDRVRPHVQGVPKSSHWGTFTAEMDGERPRVRPRPLDPDPSPLLANFADAVDHRRGYAAPLYRTGRARH